MTASRYLLDSRPAELPPAIACCLEESALGIPLCPRCRADQPFAVKQLSEAA